ncbi:MAG TPA: hypothetical protein VMX58_08720, partial [Patescibacteria group bacterium]|nr:hypothetical protein [Patescibacteria group bacterium]
GPPDNGNNLPRRWYVSNTAQGTGTGESWENAFTHPQPAVEAARAGDVIWVANGIEPHNTGGGMLNGGAVYVLATATGRSPVIENCLFGATAITNCIAWNDSAIYYDDEILVGGAILPVIRYSDIDQNGFGVDPAGTADADGNIRMNPLFAPGPLGPFYLSNTATGQLETSPCIDAGSGTAAAHGLGERTTRTDGQPDGGTVDIGYHYRIF